MRRGLGVPSVNPYDMLGRERVRFVRGPGTEEA